MNRPQTWQQINTAVHRLREQGVDHINFDLVGGLPEDTAQSFEVHFERLLQAGEPEMVHVYPYSPHSALPESPEKSAILKKARQMVEERGYRSIKNDGWGKDESSANVQVKDKIERAGSCLGLGVRARSHIFGRLAYRSVSGKDYAARLQSGEQPQYHGTVLKLRHQVQRFLIDNLRQGVSEAQFRQLFRGGVAVCRTLRSFANTSIGTSKWGNLMHPGCSVRSSGTSCIIRPGSKTAPLSESHRPTQRMAS